MQWKDGIYIDTYLPFGLRSTLKLFNILAEFMIMAWIMKQQGISPLLHYLDDFLILGPPTSNVCQQQLDAVKQVCNALGVPLALEKVEGPTTCLSFLGITLDTVNMEARLPEITEDSTTGCGMARQEKSYETQNPVPNWPATTRNQSSQAWKNLCSLAIFYCNQSLGDGFLHKAKHGLSLRYMLVVCIPAALA